MPTTHDALEGLKAEARRDVSELLDKVRNNGAEWGDPERTWANKLQYRELSDETLKLIDSLLDRAVKGERARIIDAFMVDWEKCQMDGESGRHVKAFVLDSLLSKR